MNVRRGHFMAGLWVDGEGETLRSINAASGKPVWEGHHATPIQVDGAVSSARVCAEEWANSSFEDRATILRQYAEQLRNHRAALAELICQETGKPKWESLLEVDSMVGKVSISIEAHQERRRPSAREQGGALAATRYKPIGVVAVFGPFNMPGHLPNGHIVPALLAGNTVVFKPSELTPGVGEKMVELLGDAGVPGGAMNLIQGGREVGEQLARHSGIDGFFFTGSVEGGKAISRAMADHSEKILALEMGGNSPLIVWEAADLEAASYLTIQSAFITSGQRCSCARRLIVGNDAQGSALIDRLISAMATIRVGAYWTEPEPFMGPVISDAAAERILAAQRNLVATGGVSLIESRVVGERQAMLSPGLIDVTNVINRPDAEIFGPLLQLIRVPDFDAAIAEANRTQFGLAAGLFSDNATLWDRFYRKIRAGVVYWNRQTTGGSSSLPFGGIGLSGNHRPSGYWAADYCSYPVASMEVSKLSLPASRTPGIG